MFFQLTNSRLLVVHSMDIPWVASFVVTGVALRVLTSPMHIMAEKLCAKHIHIKNHLTIRMFEVNFVEFIDLNVKLIQSIFI